MMEMGAVENFYQMDREVKDRVWTRQITCYDHEIDWVDEYWGYLHGIVSDECLDHESDWFSTRMPLRPMSNTPLTLNTMQNTSHTHLHNPHTYPFHESRSREIQLSSQKSSIHREILCQVSTSIQESFCEFYELKTNTRLTSYTCVGRKLELKS